MIKNRTIGGATTDPANRRLGMKELPTSDPDNCRTPATWPRMLLLLRRLREPIHAVSANLNPEGLDR
jgi:hypothetical protein